MDEQLSARKRRQQYTHDLWNYGEPAINGDTLEFGKSHYRIQWERLEDGSYKRTDGDGVQTVYAPKPLPKQKSTARDFDDNNGRDYFDFGDRD
jgi:hypothetical protein